MGYFTAASGGQQQGDSMQSFTAKAGIGTLALAIAAVSFLAGSAIDDANAQRGQEAQLSTRGIEWPNFSTGIDYNARERDPTGGHKTWFAEIHLLIDLGSNSYKRKVDNAAEDPSNLLELRRLLIARIDTTWPGYDADTLLINALTLRP
jgi:hypothetical protein